jgi:RNA recognition motif-containing protein
MNESSYLTAISEEEEDVVIETESTITTQIYHQQQANHPSSYHSIRNNPRQYIAGGMSSVLFEPERSVQGYVLFLRNVHPELKEDDLKDLLLDYGRPIDIKLPLDNRTGYLKGYGLVEFREKDVAERVKTAFNGYSFMGKKLAVDFGFITTSGSKPVNK